MNKVLVTGVTGYIGSHTCVELVQAANLGTARGHYVFEMIRAFERASGRALAYSIAPRRAGDIAEYYADPTLEQDRLGWRAERSMNATCRDALRRQQRAASYRL